MPEYVQGDWHRIQEETRRREEAQENGKLRPFRSYGSRSTIIHHFLTGTLVGLENPLDLHRVRAKGEETDRGGHRRLGEGDC
jgi:hypothetical protein